jgi:hypothetical protein
MRSIFIKVNMCFKNRGEDHGLQPYIGIVREREDGEERQLIKVWEIRANHRELGESEDQGRSHQQLPAREKSSGGPGALGTELPRVLSTSEITSAGIAESMMGEIS